MATVEREQTEPTIGTRVLVPSISPTVYGRVKAAWLLGDGRWLIGIRFDTTVAIGDGPNRELTQTKTLTWDKCEVVCEVPS